MTPGIAVVDGLTVRQAAPDDDGFLRFVYQATRAEELANVSWGDATRQAFFDQQCDAQAADYRRRFPEGRFLVVELDGEPVGRLYLGDADDVVHLLDISLLPEHRGRGLGEALLRWVVADGRRVSLSVVKWNPAQRLYLRLGFTVVAEQGLYLSMERAASS